MNGRSSSARSTSSTSNAPCPRARVVNHSAIGSPARPGRVLARMTVSLGMGPSWWCEEPPSRTGATTDRNLEGFPGVREAMRRPAALLPALLLLAAIAAAAPAAHARVMLVATGQATATLLDVQSGALVARVPVPGGTRAVAVAPDGVRGYVTAGARVA